MSTTGAGARTAVLMAAAGASWEAAAIERLDAAGPTVVLTKRCVDLSDLLATAGTGTATVAVVSPTLPGLDGDSVAALARSGVGVLLVAAPDELLEGDAERARRLGIDHLLVSSELAALAETVLAAAGPWVDEGPLDPGDRPVPGPTGRLLAVWGPTGAPGRTTVAVGLATGIAEAGHHVLLVDADAYGGAVAQHLGVLDEVSGLLAAARSANAGRLDAERLAGLARSVGDRLRVLTGLPRHDRWVEVRPAAYDDLLDEATRLVPHTVLDLGFSLETDPVEPFGAPGPQRNLMTLAAIQRADEVLVVGSADPVGLARLARGLVELRDLVPGIAPRVVVNRTRATLGWSDREIQGMVEGFVTPVAVHFLPEDRAAADRALMSGRSLGEWRESSLGTAMAALTLAVLGDLPARSPRRRLRRRRAG